MHLTGLLWYYMRYEGSNLGTSMGGGGGQEVGGFEPEVGGKSLYTVSQ